MPAARPAVEYPTEWGYRIVGTCADALRAAVADAVGDAPHHLEASRRSRQGTYVSFHLRLVVRDEAHRDRVLRRLQAEATIRYVL